MLANKKNPVKGLTKYFYARKSRYYADRRHLPVSGRGTSLIATRTGVMRRRYGDHLLFHDFHEPETFAVIQPAVDFQLLRVAGGHFDVADTDFVQYGFHRQYLRINAPAAMPRKKSATLICCRVISSPFNYYRHRHQSRQRRLWLSAGRGLLGRCPVRYAFPCYKSRRNTSRVGCQFSPSLSGALCCNGSSNCLPKRDLASSFSPKMRVLVECSWQI